MSDNTDAKIIKKAEASLNPIVLGEGQFGYATDTKKLSIGDDSLTFQNLPNLNGGGGGGGNYFGLNYTYSTATTPTGIAAGQIRFNSTTFGSITEAYISNTDALNIDQEAFLDLFTSGIMNLYNSAPEGYMTFKVTRMLEQTGYHKFEVTPLSGVMPVSSGDTLRLDAVMDAPGVRRLIFEADPYNVSFNVRQNSFTSDPSFSVESGYLKVTLASDMLASVSISGGGSLSDTNSSDVIPITLQLAGSDEVHCHWPSSLADDPSGGFITITATY
jgi:hypothetical protein